MPLDKTFKCYSCLYFFAIVSAFGFLCFIHTKNRKSLKIILDFHFRLLCIYHDFIIELFDGKKLTNKNFILTFISVIKIITKNIKIGCIKTLFSFIIIIRFNFIIN